MSAPGDDVLPPDASFDALPPASPEAVPAPGSSSAPEPGQAPASESAPPPGPALPTGAEVPPLEPALPPFYRRPAFRRALVAVGVLVFLFVLGLLLPSPFWRF